MARISLIALITVIFAVSFFCGRGGDIPLALLSSALIPLGILAYLQGLLIGGAAGVLCLAALIWFAGAVRIDGALMAPVAFGFGLTPVIAAGVSKLTHRIEGFFSAQEAQIDREIEKISARKEALDAQLRDVDAKVSQIVSLYEVTKEMSSTLLFSEVFDIFSVFLKKNFVFEKCKLFFLEATAEGDARSTKVGKVLLIEGAGKPEATAEPEIEPVDREILHELRSAKKIIFKSDFVSLPITRRGELVAALTVKGLDPSALERFLIVSRQFNLELEKVRLYETVQGLAITDGLTGVFTRRYFMQIFAEELERSRSRAFKLSFLMLDIDHFKNCNDQYGHLVGDAVLRDMADVLKQTIREIDVLGRYGGEEFALLLPETDSGGAAFVAERIRRSVEAHLFKAYDESLRFTLSIGVATFPADGKAETALIEAADQALYEAKAKGRNRVICKSVGKE
ncbi:MAG: GGDEF domain-containing protein [Candidatus Omnitrophota bacterium]